ncbi:uncharacterized protein JCM6883_007456 [Sporobolomyces salmoneus]|uniref:uncharacterized protein n=1 Tax=Sporobolomyces salmoneus TaxID=183962 RepID=UPI00317102DE
MLATKALALVSLLIPSLAAAQSSSSTSSSSATTCNGYSEFCDRKYSNVSIVGAHNSYGVQRGSVAANQNYTVETQLNNGIRMLQVQGHMNNNELHLCHTSCFLLDAGTFTSYLTTVKSWLDANPNEVITLLLVNSDGISPSVWAQSYVDSGLAQYVYTPSNVPVPYDSWPTLQSMISANTRVVSFLAQQADVSSVPYLLDEFTNIWETPFDETDDSFPCTVDRVTGSAEGKMYLMNHFLDVNTTLFGQTIPVPDTARLLETHASSGPAPAMSAQADQCFSNHGYYPTFTLVDYYDVGDGSVFEVAAQMNGVEYKAVKMGNATSSSTTSGGGSTTSTSLDNGSSSSLSSTSMMGSVIGLIGIASLALVV